MSDNLVGFPALPFAVHSSKLDFITLLEQAYRPPIAFASKAALDDWIEAERLNCVRVGRRDLFDVVVVHGGINVWGKGELSYSQVWVSTTYDYYRNALKFQVKKMAGPNLDGIEFHDADHAVGRARLMKHWPDGWINLMFVESGINRSVGAMMETVPLFIDAGQSWIDLNVESILKMFFKKEDSLTPPKIPEYFQEAANKMVADVAGSTPEDVALSIGERDNAINVLMVIGAENKPPITTKFDSQFARV
jgi:hypothetical protein